MSQNEPKKPPLMDELGKAFSSSGSKSQSSQKTTSGSVATRSGSSSSQRLPVVGTDDGNAQLYANQYAQVGTLLDMWAELIEGYGEKADEFYENFSTHFKNREIKGVSFWQGNLTATGLFAPYRKMEIVQRGVVTMPIYIATQGKDLYVSWRAFVQGYISLVKIGVWTAICFLVSFLFFGLSEQYEYGETSTVLDSSRCFTSFATIMIVTGIVAAAYGFFYRQGDWQAIWRDQLNELHIDDIASLTSAVHYSLIAASDKMGIDTTKLQPREPFYNPRGRKRRI